MRSRLESASPSLREWRLAAVVGGAALLAGVCAGLLLAALRRPVRAEAMVCPACPTCPPAGALAAGPGGAPAQKKLKRLPPRAEPLPGQDELGAEDQAKLRAWIEEQAGQLRACGAEHGRALLALDVTTDGKVRKAQLLAHDALPGGVSDCILQRALGWRAPVTTENRLLVNLTL